MASRKSSITAELKLAGKAQFKSGLNEAGRDARAFGRDLEKIGGKGIGGLGRQFGVARSAIIGLTAATAGAAVGVKSVFEAASNQEQLMRGLAATSDGVRSVESQFERLRIKAMESGVSVNEMAQAFTQLRGAAVGSEDAEKTAAAVANALNRVGRGADFGAVMQNLVQITSRTTGLGDEIKETANYLPQIRAISKLRFGSDTGEGLNKAGVTGRDWVAGIVDELAKYEKATGGAKAATKSFSSAWDQLKATAGSVILEPMTGVIQSITDGIEELKSNAPLLLGGAGTQKESLSREELEKKKVKAAEELKKLEEARAESVRETFTKELEISEAESKLAHAKSINDDAMILAARQELAILKEKMAVMIASNATDAEAVEFIKKRVALEQDADNIARDAERSKQRAAASDELKLLEARAGGASDRKLKKMEKGQRLGAEEDKLLKEGMAPAKAKEFARRKIEAEDRIAQDADRASMGLRPRIRGAGFKDESDSRRAGLDTATYEGLENLASMQPAPSDRRTTKGAGYKEPRQRQDGAKTSGGVGGDIAKLIAATERVEKAVLSIGPTRNDKAKPISTTAR